MPLRVSQLRFFALAGSLVLVVLLGYVVRQRLSAETVDSFRWLEHSYAVRSTILDLNATLSELQAAAYARALSPDNASVARRYDAAHGAYPPLLDKLRELTQDNPRQQEGVGYLRGRIEQKVEQLDAALHSGAALDPQTRLPIADVTDDLLGEEDRLATERQATVDQRVRTANLLTAATAIAQALLLCIVIWLAERQTARIDTASCTGYARERAMRNVATARPTPSIRPGTTPPRKRAATETPLPTDRP